jgi:quercetin dioxygenase-like cupin family protein
MRKEPRTVLIRDYKDIAATPYAGGVEKRVVIGPKQGAPTFVMRVFDLPPGTSSPFHSHDWEHEVFVLSGKGVAVAENGETSVEPDDAIFVPPHEKHCFKNTGQDTFRFMCLVPLRGEDAA